MFRVNNKDTKTAQIASFWVFIVNYELILHLALGFLLLSLSK